MLNAFVVVFSRWLYLLLSAVIMLSLLLAVTWFPNKALLMFSISNDTISFWNLMRATPQFFMANTTIASAMLTGIIIIFTGINTSLLVYYLKRRVARDRSVGLGMFGMLFGILGIGCAACGSIILSSLIGIAAAAQVIGVFPFGGIELSMLGIALLGYSIYQITKKITHTATCAV